MLRQRERGFTLLEAVVGMGIMALVVAAIAGIVTTILLSHSQAADQNAALPKVQNAGYWISRDVQMSSNVTASDPNGFPLTLRIPVDSDKKNDYRIEYLFEGSNLKRKVYDSSENLTSETLIADLIVTDNTTFTILDPVAGLHKLTVRASGGQAGVTRSYEMSQRLN